MTDEIDVSELRGTYRALTLLEEDLKDAAIGVFAGLGMCIAHKGADILPGRLVHGPASASVIGYASQPLRGALTLLAAAETVRSWQRAIDAQDAGNVEDAIGEFANMLVGRFKYGLLRRGVALLVTTPTTASGVDLILNAPVGLASRWHSYEGDGGPFFIRIDATCDAAITLDRKTAFSIPAAAGEMILF